MINGFLRPTRSTNNQLIEPHRVMPLTDELDKHPNNHDLPSTRNPVDHQSCITAKAKVLVDGRPKVVAGH